MEVKLIENIDDHKIELINDLIKKRVQYLRVFFEYRKYMSRERKKFIIRLWKNYLRTNGWRWSWTLNKNSNMNTIYFEHIGQNIILEEISTIDENERHINISEIVFTQLKNYPMWKRFIPLPTK